MSYESVLDNLSELREELARAELTLLEEQTKNEHLTKQKAEIDKECEDMVKAVEAVDAEIQSLDHRISITVNATKTIDDSIRFLESALEEKIKEVDKQKAETKRQMAEIKADNEQFERFYKENLQKLLKLPKIAAAIQMRNDAQDEEPQGEIYDILKEIDEIEKRLSEIRAEEEKKMQEFEEKEQELDALKSLASNFSSGEKVTTTLDHSDHMETSSQTTGMRSEVTKPVEKKNPLEFDSLKSLASDFSSVKNMLTAGDLGENIDLPSQITDMTDEVTKSVGKRNEFPQMEKEQKDQQLNVENFNNVNEQPPESPTTMNEEISAKSDEVHTENTKQALKEKHSFLRDSVVEKDTAKNQDSSPEKNVPEKDVSKVNEKDQKKVAQQVVKQYPSPGRIQKSPFKKKIQISPRDISSLRIKPFVPKFKKIPTFLFSEEKCIPKAPHTNPPNLEQKMKSLNLTQDLAKLKPRIPATISALSRDKGGNVKDREEKQSVKGNLKDFGSFNYPQSLIPPARNILKKESKNAEKESNNETTSCEFFKPMRNPKKFICSSVSQSFPDNSKSAQNVCAEASFASPKGINFSKIPMPFSEKESKETIFFEEMASARKGQDEYHEESSPYLRHKKSEDENTPKSRAGFISPKSSEVVKGDHSTQTPLSAQESECSERETDESINTAARALFVNPDQNNFMAFSSFGAELGANSGMKSSHANSDVFQIFGVGNEDDDDEEEDDDDDESSFSINIKSNINDSTTSNAFRGFNF